MEIKNGSLYFLKDSFFAKVEDPFLKKDHETTKRPHFFVIKDKETSLFWFVPVSSKVEKYEKIIEMKKERRKQSDGIKIIQIRDKKSVLLFQDMFPVIESYIKEPYIKGGQPVCVESKSLIAELEKIASAIKSKLQNGVKFTPTQPDIQRIEKLMLEEMEANASRDAAQAMTTTKPEENGRVDPTVTDRLTKSGMNTGVHPTEKKSILDRIKTEKERNAEKSKTEPTKPASKKKGHGIDD